MRYNPSEVYVIPRRPIAQAQAPVVSSSQHTGGRPTIADGWVSSYGRAYGEILGLTALHSIAQPLFRLPIPSESKVGWVFPTTREHKYPSRLCLSHVARSRLFLSRLSAVAQPKCSDNVLPMGCFAVICRVADRRVATS